jgi:DNA topoisomerase-1
LGITVTDFLDGYFPDIMDYGFTAKIEKDLDEVANGNAVWTDILTEFYATFEPLIKSIQSSIIPKAIMQKDERNLGKDPETNLDVLATTRKFGPVVMLVDANRNEVKTAPIKEPYTLKKVTLQQALEILEFPKTLGIYQKKSVILKVGDIGHYVDIGEVKKGGTRISLGKLEKDIASSFDMNDFAEAMEKHTKLTEEKNKDILWQNHDTKNKYLIREHLEHGKYLMVVPLIKPKINKPPLFVGVDKDIDLDQLTLKDVLEIISKHHERKKTRGKKSKGDKIEKVNGNFEENVDEKKPTKKVTTEKKTTEKKPTKKVTTEKKTIEKKPTKKKPTKKTTDSEESMFAQKKK